MRANSEGCVLWVSQELLDRARDFLAQNDEEIDRLVDTAWVGNYYAARLVILKQFLLHHREYTGTAEALLAALEKQALSRTREYVSEGVHAVLAGNTPNTWI